MPTPFHFDDYLLHLKADAETKRNTAEREARIEQICQAALCESQWNALLPTLTALLPDWARAYVRFPECVDPLNDDRINWPDDPYIMLTLTLPFPAGPANIYVELNKDNNGWALAHNSFYYSRPHTTFRVRFPELDYFKEDDTDPGHYVAWKSNRVYDYNTLDEAVLKAAEGADKAKELQAQADQRNHEASIRESVSKAVDAHAAKQAPACTQSERALLDALKSAFSDWQASDE